MAKAKAADVVPSLQTMKLGEVAGLVETAINAVFESENTNVVVSSRIGALLRKTD